MTTEDLKQYFPNDTTNAPQISFINPENSEYSKYLEYILFKTKCNISYRGNTHLN